MNLFVEHGFIHELRLGDEGSVRYDINTDPHHHLLDKESGQVLDLPFDSVQISNLEELEREYSLQRISVTIEGKSLVAPEQRSGQFLGEGSQWLN